jgi:methyl-accepting chemotaxis protein
MIGNLNIRKKLYLGFGIIIIFLVFVSTVSIISVKKINRNSVFIKDIAFQQAIYLIEFEGLLKQIGTHISASVNAGTMDGLRQALQVKESLDEQWTEADTILSKNKVIANSVNDLKDEVEAYMALGQDLVDMTVNQEWLQIPALSKNFAEKENKIFARIDDLKNNGVGKLDSSLTEIVNLIKNTIVIISLITIIAIVAGSALAFFIGHSIVKPVRLLTDITLSVASGDLTKEVHLQAKDEIGKMGNALGSLVSHFKKLISDVVASTYQVSGSANQVSSSSDKISQAASDEASSVEETTASMSEMAASISEVVRHTDSLAASADETVATASEIAASIEQVGKNSEVMASSVDDVTATIEQMLSTVEETAQDTALMTETVTATSLSVENQLSSIEQIAKNTESLKSMVMDTSSTIEEMTRTVGGPPTARQKKAGRPFSRASRASRTSARQPKRRWRSSRTSGSAQRR